MNRVRLTVILIGIFLPYLARIPGALLYGPGWFTSYLGDGVGAILFFGAFNAVAWGAVLFWSSLLKEPGSMLFPSIPAFLWIAFAHGSVDLSADAQAAIALVIIPFFAIPCALVGGGIAFYLERRANKEAD